MTYTHAIEEAGKLWHERIGRFLTPAAWDASLGVAFPAYKSKKDKSGAEVRIKQRIGVAGTSFVMIDANEAILLDRIDLSEIDAQAPGANFKYGESALKIENAARSQINWALDEARKYPLLLIRPALASSLKTLKLSHTDDQIEVCVPNGSFSFEPKKVRVARDFILAAGLQKKWRTAARLRQTISLGEHIGSSRENKLLEEHAAMLELIPADVWLPDVGSGNEIALGDALAEKPETSLTHLPVASALLRVRTAQKLPAEGETK
jgi:hypothetical protein